MKSNSLTHRLLSWMGVVCLAAALAACGGGGGDGGGGIDHGGADGGIVDGGGGGGDDGGGDGGGSSSSQRSLTLGGRVYLAAGGGNVYDNAKQVSVTVFDAAGGTKLAEGATGDEGDIDGLSVPAGKVVVQLNKTGYVTQTVPVDLANDGNFVATLLPVGTSKTADNFAQGGTFTGPDGTSVVVDANSFVTPDGKPVTGPVQVDITPYNAAANPAAFPGNPMQSDGIMVSMGMTDFTFTQNGQKLQLAAGKTAKVVIPLYAAIAPDGTQLKVGDSVPVWSMDSATGRWTEETDIQGTVVESPASPTGLAMLAIVPHFTWWNCDYLRGIRQIKLTVYDVKGDLYNGSAWLKATFYGNVFGLGQYSTTGNTALTLENGVAMIDVPSDAVNGDFTLTTPDGFSGYVHVAQDVWQTISSITMHLVPTPKVTLSPTNATLVFFDEDIAGGKQIQYSAATENLSNPKVTWLVNGIAGGDSSVGTISPSGLYKSPTGNALKTLLDSGTTVIITARSVQRSSVYAESSLTLRNPSVIIVGQTYGHGQNQVGGYDEWYYSSSIIDSYTSDPVLSYAIHNKSTDRFYAYYGDAAHPLTGVQWSLLCYTSVPSRYNGYMYQRASDCASDSKTAGRLQISHNGTLTVNEIVPVQGDETSGSASSEWTFSSPQAYYGVPLVWVKVTASGGREALMRLVVAPVEDPVGDKVVIAVPREADGGQYSMPPVTNGQVSLQSTEPGTAVTAPITWGLKCLKSDGSTNCQSPMPTIDPVTGMLSGMNTLPSVDLLDGSRYFYVTADWTTNSKPNHLVQCIYGGMNRGFGRCDMGQWGPVAW